jgi:multidrug resistance efflux pump
MFKNNKKILSLMLKLLKKALSRKNKIFKKNNIPRKNLKRNNNKIAKINKKYQKEIKVSKKGRAKRNINLMKKILKIKLDQVLTKRKYLLKKEDNPIKLYQVILNNKGF